MGVSRGSLWSLLVLWLLPTLFCGKNVPAGSPSNADTQGGYSFSARARHQRESASYNADQCPGIKQDHSHSKPLAGKPSLHTANSKASRGKPKPGERQTRT